MRIVLAGLSHRTAPLPVREMLAFSDEELAGALRSLKSWVEEGFLLSTCNRTELYGLVHDPEKGTRDLLTFLELDRRVPIEHFHRHLYCLEGEEVVQHLFRVACGLDSMILGESQVLGQVRGTYQVAEELEAVGPILGRLLRHAVSVGKQARSETGISKHALSLSYAAVELVRQRLGDLRLRQILVIGAGETGKLTAKILLNCGAGSIVVMNRTLERAQEVAALFGARASEMSQLENAFEESDIVISATGAPNHIVTRSQVERAMARRDGRELVIVDLALPRDVDPRVEELAGVYLYNVDNLQGLCAANLCEREQEAAKVERIIEEEVSEFMAWWKAQEVVPTITALLEKAESIRQAELSRALSRLGSLPPRDVATLESLTSSIVKKMLHQPIVSLKKRASMGQGKDYALTLRELFGMTNDI